MFKLFKRTSQKATADAATIDEAITLAVGKVQALVNLTNKYVMLTRGADVLDWSMEQLVSYMTGIDEIFKE